jgi:hypothetical protein
MANIFNERAAEAGREYVFDFPRASNVQIDEAAPKLNPARRHFTNAARFLQNDIAKLGKVFYRWEVKTTDDRVVGFCAESDEAQAEVKLWMKLAKQDGEKVLGYTIENQDGILTSGMSYRQP